MTKTQKIKVWDIGVRVFHWCLVVLFVVAYLSGEEESLVHIYSGYGIIVLVILRIIWGFVGTPHARFSDFVYGPKKTFQYVRSLFTAEPIHYLGHNPLGGWMVIALLISLAGVSWTGLELYGVEGYGPLAGEEHSFVATALANDDNDEHDADFVGEEANGKEAKEEFWEEAHEISANLTLFLVFLHIGGVLIGSVLHRENLIKAMITGYKER